MDSNRLQTFERSLGAQSANIDTRRHWKKKTDSLSGVYICIYLSTCTRQLLLMYYMHAQHIFCSLVEIENASSTSGLTLPLGTVEVCAGFKKVQHVDNPVQLSSNLYMRCACLDVGSFNVYPHQTRLSQAESHWVVEAQGRLFPKW